MDVRKSDVCIKVFQVDSNEKWLDMIEFNILELHTYLVCITRLME